MVTESYIFLDKSDLEDREWDFAEFKREKLRKWTRAGYVFEGECTWEFRITPPRSPPPGGVRRAPNPCPSLYAKQTN